MSRKSPVPLPQGLLQIWGTGELRDSFLRDQLCLKASHLLLQI